MPKRSESSASPARPRLKDVADRANVTKSIASRILNSSHNVVVQPSTRARVLEAAAELGYQPNAIAQALTAAETRTIACILPPLTNPVYARIIQTAYRRALAHGYVMLVAEDSGGSDIEKSLLRLIDRSRVDGLIMGSAHRGHHLIPILEKSAVPHVYVNREVTESRCSVTMDDARASEVVIEYLYRQGHREIVHLAGPMTIDTNRRRRIGHRNAATKFGLTFLEVECGDLSEAAGFAGAATLIKQYPMATAVYVSSVRRAIGALRLFTEKGIGVPHDISLVTNDDMELAAYMSPSLTTLRMPIDLLGETAVDEVVRQISGKPPRNLMIATVPEIIERKSVRHLS